MKFEDAIVNIIVRKPDDLVVESGFVQKVERENSTGLVKDQEKLKLHLDTGYKIAVTEKPEEVENA